jgi:type I restriction enzyme R subunit
VRSSGGAVRLKTGAAKPGVAPPLRKVSVQEVIAEVRSRFDISDEEALFIRQVTEEKAADPEIRNTVITHREDRIFLEGAYQGQVNSAIQMTYDSLGRYNELADPKYTDPSGIFDIMAYVVIQRHLAQAA